MASLQNYEGPPTVKNGCGTAKATIVLIVILVLLTTAGLAFTLYNYFTTNKTTTKQESARSKYARMAADTQINAVVRPARMDKSAHMDTRAPLRADLREMSAPLPAMQLMSAPEMPDLDLSLQMMNSASANIGDSDMNRTTTEIGGISANPYADFNYRMDAGAMSPAAASEIQGIQSFMPLMNDGVNQETGPIDPTTGLPLLTTGKLIRSQMLGGHGAGSFLRQQQDPLSGYKRLGKNMCGAQSARRDLALRRAQFNEARLADPTGDPVLFQSSEFAYQ